MYFPESDSPFYRVTYLSNYSPKMTPPGEHFSLLAEVSASRFKQENADDVVDRTIKGMLSSKLLTPEQAESKIVSRQLLRVPYSYPVPTIGRDRALAAIHPWLIKQEIYSRGRFGACACRPRRDVVDAAGKGKQHDRLSRDQRRCRPTFDR